MNDAARTRAGLPVSSSALTTVLFAVVVVAALYLGREVLMPSRSRCF